MADESLQRPRSRFKTLDQPLFENLMAEPLDASETACFVTLSRKHGRAFTRFLELLNANGDADFFHPHALDAEGAKGVIVLSESGHDEYWAVISGDDVLVYGFGVGMRATIFLALAWP